MYRVLQDYRTSRQETKEKRSHGGDRRTAEVKHRCGVAECNACAKFVELRTHNCYIQPVEEEMRRRRSNEELWLEQND